ncbi:LIC11435 family protein [Leptospira sp. 'Mane']|uniref:LIC11435 family protein n=1 Tax=Leptospira sp. 'Mane' TaxID=3387407 RepID=UPI00398B885B
MWNRILNGFFSLCFIFFVSSIYSEESVATEEFPQAISWQEVPGASSYILEIKNSNGYMVLSEKTTSNTYNVTNLGSGVYEHRVGVVNRLGKVGAYSEWVKFEVVVSKIPTLTNDSIYSISKEDKQKVFDLQGTDFVDQMKVYMVIDGKKIPAKKVEVESSTRARAIFDIDPGMNTGIYDLVLENPRKKALSVNQRIVFSETKEKANRFAVRQERILKKEIPEDYYQTPYWSTFWRSSLIPGWGQRYIDGQNWKFYVYPVVAIGIAGAYAGAYSKFLSARSSYGDAVLVGVFLAEDPNSQVLWLLNRNSAQANFNSAKQQLNTIQTGAGVFGLFVLYNLVDSYFSAKRNVAGLETLPGFPLGQETARVNAKMAGDPFSSIQPVSGYNVSSSYQLEFSLRY